MQRPKKKKRGVMVYRRKSGPRSVVSCSAGSNIGGSKIDHDRVSFVLQEIKGELTVVIILDHLLRSLSLSSTNIVLRSQLILSQS